MTDHEPTFVPVPPPDDGPSPAEVAAPVDRSQPRPQDAPQQSSRSWVLAAVILAVIALTAAWQLLGLWVMVGGIVCVLILIGAVAKWRHGSRPTLSGIGLPSWNSASKPQRSKRRPSSDRRGDVPRASKTRRPSPDGKGSKPARPAAKTRGGPGPGQPPRPPKNDKTSPSRKSRKDAGKANWKRTWRRTRAVGKILATPLMLIVAGGVEMYQQLYDQDATQVKEAAPAPTEDEAQPAEPDPVDPTPVPGPKVKRPIAEPSNPSTRTTSTGASMSSPVVHAAAEAIREHIGGFVGQNAADFTSFVGGLDELFDTTWEALGSANGRFSDDDPISPAVVEHLEQIRAMVSALAEFARDGAAVFQAAHEADLERLDNPRPGEEKMDYSQQ